MVSKLISYCYPVIIFCQSDRSEKYTTMSLHWNQSCFYLCAIQNESILMKKATTIMNLTLFISIPMLQFRCSMMWFSIGTILPSDQLTRLAWLASDIHSLHRCNAQTEWKDQTKSQEFTEKWSTGFMTVCQQRAQTWMRGPALGLQLFDTIHLSKRPRPLNHADFKPL